MRFHRLLVSLLLAGRVSKDITSSKLIDCDSFMRLSCDEEHEGEEEDGSGITWLFSSIIVWALLLLCCCRSPSSFFLRPPLPPLLSYSYLLGPFGTLGTHYWC